jgi:hypothetical protein
MHPMSTLPATTATRLLPTPRSPLAPAAALLVASAVLAAPLLGLSPAAHASGEAPTANSRDSSASAAGPQLARPSKDALSLAELVRARGMGIDHLGNLWGWNGVEGSMRFFSPTAARLGTLLISKSAMAADGDLEWGVVALDGDGARLIWVRPGETAEAEAAAATPPAAAPAPAGTDTTAAAAGSHTIDLPEIAAWVCWVDADVVAISPQRADHRVELWNLRDRKMVKSFGKEQKIVLKSGANRVREVQLHYDAARRLLYTLETFSGDLAVFRIDGTPVWHAVFENPWRQVEEAKLAILDAKAKVNDSAYPQMFSDLWLGEGPDGSAWVRQGVEPDKQIVHLAKATASGSSQKTVEKLRCPAKSFTIWGDDLIFFRDVASPRAVCNSVAPLP